MKNWKIYVGPVFAVFVLAILGIWHSFGVMAGADGSGNGWLTAQYKWLFVGVLAGLAVIAFFLEIKKWPIEKCSAACVLILGSMYMFVLPPLSAPDEVSHFVSAYELSNRIMGKMAVDADGYVRIRREDDFLQNMTGAQGDEEHISLGRLLNEETYHELHERRTPLFVESTEMISSVYRPVRTTPVAYLFQAVGITAARLFSLNGVILSYLGRIFNLLFFAGFCWLSIKLLPFGKEIMAGVAILPMTLHLAASYSYDTFVMSLCFFFAAYCLNLAFCKERVRKRDVAVLAVTIAALGPCKMIYAVVLGFALLIPVKKFGGKRQWLLSALAVFAAFAAAMVVVNRATVSIYASGADNFVTWAGEEGYSIPLIFHNPLLYVRMLYQTLQHQLDVWYMTMFGSSLGNLDPVLSVPFFIVAGMTASLVLLSVRNAGEALYLRAGQKCWILFLSAICLLGLMTAMLVSWTPLSSQVIEGVQGRYLLPLLPFVLMTVKSDRLVRTAGQDRRILFYMCVMNGYALLNLFSIVSMRL